MYSGLNSKIILAFMMCIFLVGTVSAFEFDNREFYDEATDTYTIRDSLFGFPTTKVSEISREGLIREGATTVNLDFNYTLYEDNYENPFKYLRLDKLVRGQWIEGEQVPFEILIKQGTRLENEDIYTQSCSLDAQNLSNQICISSKTGSREINVGNYIPLDQTNLRGGNYAIRLILEKGIFDESDWILNLNGRELLEWDFLGNSLAGYWTFDNEDRTAAFNVDNNSINNFTDIIGPGKSTEAKIGSFAMQFNRTDSDEMNNSINFSEGQDFSWSFWINATDVTTEAKIVGHPDQPSGNRFLEVQGGNIRFEIGASSAVAPITANLYHLVVATWDNSTSTARIFVDNDNVANATSVTIQPNQPPFIVGAFGVPGSQFFNGTLDEVAYWEAVLTVDNVNTLWNSSDGIPFTNPQSPSDIFLTSIINTPINNTQTSNQSLTFNSSVITIQNVNLTNATILIYSSATTLHNQSNISVTGSSVLNESIINISNLFPGTYFWNVQLCGISNNASSSTVCNQSASNFTFSINAIINQSVNFSNPTIEGSTESFVLNLTFNSSILNLGSATFNYNNTLNTSIIAGTGNNRIITSSIIIPNVTSDVNQTFFWNLSFTNIITSGSFIESTTLTNQTVLNIGLDTCTSFTNRILNFTVQDEELQTFIADATIETAVDLFDVSRTVLVANVSGNFTNPTTICLNLNLTNTTIYSLDVIARYELPLQFANEYFNIANSSLTINSTVQDIILFDLNISDSTEFQLTFTGSDFLPVENALVFVDRQYIAENVFKTVELPKTDSNGQTILHLVRNDIVYNIRISKDGTILGNFENLVAFCEDFAIGDCKIDLNAGAGTEALFNYDTELGITFTGPTYNNDTRVITFDFLTSDGSAKTILMNVTRSDIFGNRTVCEDSLLSSGGTLSCTIPSNIDDADLIINVFVDGQQSIFKVIKLDLTDFGVAGYLVLFVMSLSLILMFSASKTGILLAVLLSFAGAIGLGLITSNLLGVGASGLWLVIIVLIGIWKLNKDRVQ